MAEWADVYVDDLDNRVPLQNSAVFFIPSALGLLESNQINTSRLCSESEFIRNNSGRGNSGQRLCGRSAITKVMKCLPVVYKSASGFIEVANTLLKSRDSSAALSKGDIVACVFKIHGLAEVVRDKKTSVDDIARASGVHEDIIQSLLRNCRVQYVDAQKILSALRTIFSGKPDSDRFKISTEIAKSIDRVAVGSFRNSDDYVYKRQMLAPAPTNGHAWSIEYWKAHKSAPS